MNTVFSYEKSEFLTGNEPKHMLEKDGKMQTNWILKKSGHRLKLIVV